MKLRIRDNSIRLRLMRSEVEVLRDNGLVEASTAFPGGRTFREDESDMFPHPGAGDVNC